MLRQRPRSARGFEAETDPRFLEHAPAMGVVRANNFGQSAVLLGADAAARAKLLKFDAGDPRVGSWAVSVTSQYVGGSAPVAGVLASGTFGTGGTVCKVEFDVKPDASITLPGQSIDLDAAWAPVLFGTAGNVLTSRVDITTLPERALLNAVAVSGDMARGRPTRTQIFVPQAAGTYNIPIPAFADEMMINVDRTFYAGNITDASFRIGGAAGQLITNYTGAEVLAIRDAGMLLPVPGVADHLRITLPGAGGVLYLTYTLSL